MAEKSWSEMVMSGTVDLIAFEPKNCAELDQAISWLASPDGVIHLQRMINEQDTLEWHNLQKALVSCPPHFHFSPVWPDELAAFLLEDPENLRSEHTFLDIFSE